jgi:hypothetical protein
MTDSGEKPNKRQVGIRNQSVIDSVSCDKETQRATLNMIEDRFWSDLDLDAWGREIMAKANLYLSYIDERLFSDYPQLARESPEILLTCVHYPPPPVVVKLRKLKLLLKQEGVEFSAADVTIRVKIDL